MIRRSAVAFVALFALTPALTGQGARASEHDHLINKHATAYGVPPDLVRRVIHIESKGNPRVVSSGNYGLMQIRLGTARAMGYAGDAEGLLDADTNMTYAVRYLAGAYRAAGGNSEQAIRNYQRGYYDKAKAQGFSPYAAPSSLPQAAAPDPTMLRQQQDADRRKAAELQRVAALESRIEQQKIAEQARIAERRAAVEARLRQQEAAEREHAARRQAEIQARTDRQNAQQRARAEQQQALEQKRAEQRQAALQQKIDREQQQRAAAEQAKQKMAAAQPAAQQPRTETQAQPSAAPVPAAAAAPRRPAATPTPAYAWYNPMRYFKHPAHQAHPLQRDR